MNTKQELEEILRSYQNVGRDNLYEMKKFTDEAENVFIMQNTIFLGTDKMQIKKLDGSVEKYNIEKYYPVDEKDEKIKELNKKVEELERRLNNEHAESIKPIKDVNESNVDDDGNVNRKSKTDSKSISK